MLAFEPLRHLYTSSHASATVSGTRTGQGGSTSLDNVLKTKKRAVYTVGYEKGGNFVIARDDYYVKRTCIEFLNVHTGNRRELYVHPSNVKIVHASVNIERSMLCFTYKQKLVFKKAKRKHKRRRRRPGRVATPPTKKIPTESTPADTASVPPANAGEDGVVEVREISSSTPEPPEPPRTLRAYQGQRPKASPRKKPTSERSHSSSHSSYGVRHDYRTVMVELAKREGSNSVLEFSISNRRYQHVQFVGGSPRGHSFDVFDQDPSHGSGRQRRRRVAANHFFLFFRPPRIDLYRFSYSPKKLDPHHPMDPMVSFVGGESPTPFGAGSGHSKGTARAMFRSLAGNDSAGSDAAGSGELRGGDLVWYHWDADRESLYFICPTKGPIVGSGSSAGNGSGSASPAMSSGDRDRDGSRVSSPIPYALGGSMSVSPMSLGSAPRHQHQHKQRFEIRGVAFDDPLHPHKPKTLFRQRLRDFAVPSSRSDMYDRWSHGHFHEEGSIDVRLILLDGGEMALCHHFPVASEKPTEWLHVVRVYLLHRSSYYDVSFRLREKFISLSYASVRNLLLIYVPGTVLRILDCSQDHRPWELFSDLLGSQMGIPLIAKHDPGFFLSSRSPRLLRPSGKDRGQLAKNRMSNLIGIHVNVNSGIVGTMRLCESDVLISRLRKTQDFVDYIHLHYMHLGGENREGMLRMLEFLVSDSLVIDRLPRASSGGEEMSCLATETLDLARVFTEFLIASSYAALRRTPCEYRNFYDFVVLSTKEKSVSPEVPCSREKEAYLLTGSRNLRYYVLERIEVSMRYTADAIEKQLAAESERNTSSRRDRGSSRRRRSGSRRSRRKGSSGSSSELQPPRKSGRSLVGKVLAMLLPSAFRRTTPRPLPEPETSSDVYTAVARRIFMRSYWKELSLAIAMSEHHFVRSEIDRYLRVITESVDFLGGVVLRLTASADGGTTGRSFEFLNEFRLALIECRFPPPEQFVRKHSLRAWKVLPQRIFLQYVEKDVVVVTKSLIDAILTGTSDFSLPQLAFIIGRLRMPELEDRYLTKLLQAEQSEQLMQFYHSRCGIISPPEMAEKIQVMEKRQKESQRRNRSRFQRDFTVSRQQGGEAMMGLSPLAHFQLALQAEKKGDKAFQYVVTNAAACFGRLVPSAVTITIESREVSSLTSTASSVLSTPVTD